MHAENIGLKLLTVGKIVLPFTLPSVVWIAGWLVLEVYLCLCRPGQ